jgi:NTE family protein
MAGANGGNGAPKRRKIALALQGGGSHGAFTWGVLDRLLEDPTFEIIGVTGTSAGAMNAICLAEGLAEGGPEQARRQLRQFWEAVGQMPGLGGLLRWIPGETLAHMRIEQTPPYMVLDAIRRNLTPDEFNPTKANPLRDALEAMIDFDRLRDNTDLVVQVCATNVRTARRRVFSNQDISVDAVLASATLPDLFPAVEIDGEMYWDGGFSGNPAMAGLIRVLPKCDFIIVRIDPVIRKEMPSSARDIHDRVTELSFNTTFWMELSAIAAVLQLVEEGELDRERFGRLFFHAIEASDQLEKIPPSTKLNNAPAFLTYLFDLGRTTADKWIARRGADVGVKSTIDLTKLLPVTQHPVAAAAASIPVQEMV